MTGRKKVEDATIEVQSVLIEFSKEQILASARYSNNKDLVDAILDEKKKYDLETVDSLVKEYMKGKVK
jgi:hypothetical protein